MYPIGNRLESFRKKLGEKGLDGALVMKKENYMYMSGFTGTSAYLIITQHDAVLVTDFRYREQAEIEASLYEVVQFQGDVHFTLEEQLKAKGVKRLGFEGSFLSYDRYMEFKSKLGVDEMVPMGGIIESLRVIKDEKEIEIIKKAVEIADMAFSHILGLLKPGVRETEVAAELEYHMKKLGASGASFETIVASGKRSSMPHGVASEKALEKGDAITLDFGAVYKGYCSDMTRTVFLGKPGAELEKIYRIVLEAQEEAMEKAAKGLKGSEIDRIARDIIAREGYGDYFGHGLGHGVGLEIHEEPRLSTGSSTTMENGMTVTVEPGIYISGLGGVRIEDIIVINGDNPIVLTKSPKEMIIL